MRVLLVNELGGGLGHLVPLMTVATALGAGWDRRFVVPDPDRAGSFVAEAVGAAVAVNRAPPWARPKEHVGPEAPPTHAFADALHATGLGDADAWRRVLRFWSDLFAAVRPDLIVTDAAPGVRLAAAGRVPVVAVGNGYSTPPAGRLLPSLVAAKPDVPPATRRREALILAAVNEVQAERQGPTLDHVADLFSGDATVVGTHPALDPYRAHRAGPTWWPCAVPLPQARPPRGRAGVPLFVYLHAGHPGLGAVLDLVARTARVQGGSGVGDPTSEIYVLGGDPRRIAERCGHSVTVHERLVDLADLLARTRLLVHHGGTGMSHEALASGTAQLLLPLTLEQVLTSRALQSLGVGSVVMPPAKGAGDPYGPALEDAAAGLLRPDIQHAADRWAADLASSRPGDTVGTIVETCRRLVGRASPAAPVRVQ